MTSPAQTVIAGQTVITGQTAIAGQTVRAAPPDLEPFVAAEVLGPTEVHVAVRLAQWWPMDDRVRLAAALAVRALRGGSVCLDLTAPERVATDVEERLSEGLPWPTPAVLREALAASPAVAHGPTGDDDRPLRVVGDLLYLQRYWHVEESVRAQLSHREGQAPPLVDSASARRTLDALFDGGDLPVDEPDQQRLAAAMALVSPVTVIAGGPGTGKTTTVAKVLALLHATSATPPTIALVAPTGKAAARLEEAVRDSLVRLGDPWRAALGDVSARTIHRLLGGYRRFRHDRHNPLPHDVVVVDEMSMVSLPLMASLLEAVRPDARLLLVGDPDQLTSVEAGAVMADIARADIPANPLVQSRAAEIATGDRPAPHEIRPGVVTLSHTWRFDGGIDSLARAIRAGDADAVVEVLSSDSPKLRWTPEDATEAGPTVLADVSAAVIEPGRRLHASAVAGDAPAALESLDRHRLLCAHRHGLHGVSHWARLIEGWLRDAIEGYGQEGDWYPGLPLMATANDADANLFNGDTGVMVQTPDGLRGAFARGGTPALYSTIQLDSVVPVHAMTVHKSQGSQFASLTFIVPPERSPLLTRELLYTAVTRASEHVHVIGSETAIRRAVERPANRASGLSRRDFD